MKTINYKGKQHKVFTIKTNFDVYEAILSAECYREPETLAVEALCVVDGRVTVSLATLTVNLDPYTGFGVQSDTEAYVDTNNCPWAPAFLEKNGLATATGERARSGFCIFPLYRWNTAAFLAPEKPEDKKKIGISTVEDLCEMVGESLDTQEEAQRKVEAIVLYLYHNDVIKKFSEDAIDRLFSDDRCY